MSLLSFTEVLRLELETLGLRYLRELCVRTGLNKRGNSSELVKRVIASAPDAPGIEQFIKEKYLTVIKKREALITATELKVELGKVEEFSWGIVQGLLDNKIQARYVRNHVRYDDLIRDVKKQLHDDVTSYVICTWYNHWTTVLIEEYISQHKNVTPALKKVKGVDIFFDGQPFDLKTTYLPKGYEYSEAVTNPRALIIWLYENQGAQRFGGDNRLYVVLYDSQNPEDSWKLKRDFELIGKRVDDFFDNEKVGGQDEVVFSYGRRTYTAISKLLFITR
jgi:hypothetical protein